MTTFTTPNTAWSTDDVPGASDLNTLGNNELHLLNGISQSGRRDNGSDYTTTSTSFAAIDNTNLVKTVTLAGTKAIILFHGTFLESGGGNRVDLDIEVNGTRWGVAGTEGLISSQLSTTVTPISLPVVIDGLTPGSNTFKMLWKVSTTTGILRSGSGVAGNDGIPSFDVWGA